MTSVSRQEFRKATCLSRAALMRTAATALVAASPLLHSGAASAAVGGVQLTAPIVKNAKKADFATMVATGKVQLNAPTFIQGYEAGQLAAAIGNFRLDAPTLQSGSPARQLSHAVKNLLAVPMDAKTGGATISASAFAITPMAATQSYDNSSDITVSDVETAIDIDANPDSIVINNSGDLTGGGGINVVTGDLDPSQIVNQYQTGWNSPYYANLYDNAGNPVTEPCYSGSSYQCNVRVKTADVYTSYVLNDVDADQTDASITVGNSGNINFSGIYGIRTKNEAGASIGITNSGDISATQDTDRRVGIFADTAAPGSRVVDGPNEIVPGEYTYNSYGQLTGVIATGQHEKTTTITSALNDGGSISIVNSGAIDMGVVDVSDLPPGYAPGYAVSEGIYARGWGGTQITNSASGSITVGDFSKGITSVSGGDVTIVNDGTITIGNMSRGIHSVAGDRNYTGDTYLLAGNTSIINTGDIVGGLTKSEAAASGNAGAFSTFKPVEAIGIHAEALGTNRDYYGNIHHIAEAYALYGVDPSWVAQYYPELQNLTTTVRNGGTIALKDGGLGIYGAAVYGDMRAYNSGTITVGEGSSNFQGNNDLRAQGIYMNNFPLEGLANFYAKNEAGGIIVTGDDGAGIFLQTAGGSAVAVNEGSITVGKGGVGDWTNYANGNTYDWLFPSLGMGAHTAGTFIGQYAAAVNGVSGDITVGELGVGMQVFGRSGMPFGGGDPIRTTAFLINDGTVTGGNNSTGLMARGRATMLVNTGDVTIGSKDLSGFILPPAGTAGASNFGTMGFGIQALSTYFGTLYNSGTVTTGDNTIGVFNGTWANHGGYQIATIQNGDGVVTTGDNSVGIRTEAFGLAVLDNAGRVSVGDNSVGVDMTAGRAYFDSGVIPDVGLVVQPGSVQAVNDGIIETGDNSVGVRLNGIREVDYAGFGVTYTGTPYPWSYDVTYYQGTVDVVGSAILENSGTIRVGTNSTAVEITGTGVYGVNLYNVGTIDGGAGTAIKINADNAIGTTILNGGTIIGDVQLGDGDDLFLHAQNVDPATGQALSTGNIIMDGHRIDFGGGTNTFHINRGVISVTDGDDNLITGDNLTVEMDYGEIDARDDFISGIAPLSIAAAPFAHDSINFSTLTIDGDVSGNFRFAADVGPDGESDRLVVNGDLLDGTDAGIILNPVHQMKGEVEIRPMTIGGANDADSIDVAGVTGLFADSLVGWETSYQASSGDVVINATFGLGHMGTAANAAAVSAQNWLTSSLSSFGNRNIHAYTGRKGEGLAVWGYAFQDEGEIRPGSDLQDLGFRQVNSGFQAGVQWGHDLWGGRVSVSPMFTYGTAEANMIANTASGRSHPWAVGLNANYVGDGGLYVDATYQHMQAKVDLKTPGTATQATGEAEIHGQGFNLEAGYAHKLKSGLVVEPQLQVTHTQVDADDFATSDGIYALSDIDGKATTVRAGLSVYKVFETKSGSITPLASLSYINGISGETALASNGVGFDSDTSGSGYKAEIGVLGRHEAWDFAGKLAFSKTSATGNILSPSLNVRYAFGGAAKAAATAGEALPEIKQETLKFAQGAAPQDIAGPPVVRDEPQPAETEQAEQLPAEQTPSLDAPADPAAEQAPAEENADIVVTGSIVRRGAPPEISPVTVITSEEMATKGLQTLGDVMNSFTQNDGLSQGKASNLLGRFTHGAEEVNFRGLGTGRTLVLVNGRRIADYPLPFGGEQNGADLGAIPFSAVANVQYLSSGASATYGSDAVGGVVNIITKRDMEQTSVDLTAGAYQEGFGKSLRASAVTGNSYAKGSFTVGAEATYSGEILASDSKYLRKNAPFEAGMVSILENDASGMSPIVPEASCAPLGFEFDSASSECVADISDTISLSPTIKKLSAFFDGRYDLSDNVELFATGMAAKSWIKARSNVLFWQGVVGADDDSAAMFITRGFSEDELGISTIKLGQFMWSGVVGAKGGINVGSDVWYWDVALSHGSYKTNQVSRNLKEEGIKNWILDGASSVTDSPDQRYTYFVDPAFYNGQLVDNIVRPVDPSDIDSLVGNNVMKASSSASTLSATLNGQIGDLGFMYKPAKFALRAEYARQTTEINPDERSLNTTGQGWFNIGSIQADGKRSRWALAAEIDATPIDNLDIMLAARYDHYDDASSVKGRVTGQAKFLYRPTDWLKIRGGYGQTFRAPDMFNLYGESSGFEFVPDYSQPGCFDGTNYFCGYSQVPSTRRADASLTEEHGDDIGLGAIFNPIPNFTLTVDWYRIKLKDLVITESSSDLVLKEWQCDNGVLDGSSQLCGDVHNRVIRNGFGAIERVIVQPINQDSLTRQGIDIRASYKLETAKLGAFNFDLGYSKVLKFELNRFAGDEPLDLKYGEVGAATPANGLSAGLSWYMPLTTGKAVSAGVFVQRQGRVKDYSGSQFLEPFYDVNLTVGYQLNTRTSARLSINNLLGADPVANGSNIWPGYWAHLQNAFGRSFAISIGHSFN